MSTLRTRLEERLTGLRKELADGEKLIADLQARQNQIRETLLRISGAVQVLEEELEEELEGDGAGDAPPAPVQQLPEAVAPPVPPAAPAEAVVAPADPPPVLVQEPIAGPAPAPPAAAEPPAAPAAPAAWP